jgi:multidrug efflux pump subunit AcrB
MRVALKRGSGIRIEELKTRLREKLPQLARERPPAMNDVKLSFEAGDIVAEVMSFGSPTPVEAAVSSKSFPDTRAYAAKVRQELAQIPSLRDLQYAQSLDYPTLDVNVDREKAGMSGVTATDVANALAPATLSSRFTARNFWRDPKSGIGYQVQVEVPAAKMDSIKSVETVPVKYTPGGQVLVRDVANVSEGTMPGEYDRYNMRRLVSMTANIEGEDLGRVAKHINQAVKAAGRPPGDVTVDVRGQVVPMQQMFTGLSVGLVMAVVVIFLLLTANFQSLRLAFVVVSTTPAVITGVALALVITRTTLNIQSFMGAIMAIGVAVANAILLVTFAEEYRRAGNLATAAAIHGAKTRMRPILMTSLAMIAGMVPMALGLGEGSQQTAPLARAVIGGLLFATGATLLLLPLVFSIVQERAGMQSPSLDPDDPASVFAAKGLRSPNSLPGGVA